MDHQDAPELGQVPTSGSAGNPGVSVIVVSYNTRDLLKRCLASIEPHHQIIVVDNASVDGSADMVEREFPHAELIRNRINEGFGAANNRGMTRAVRPLTLFLNSDCIPSTGAIDILAEEFGHFNVCAAGGRLLNSDGSVQDSAAKMLQLHHVFLEQSYLERLFGGYWVTPRQKGLTRSVEVEQVMGACLMIRTGSALFDERYFLYCEDTDLLLRLTRETKGAVHYCPRATFTHELGASSRGSSRWVAVARYNRGKELFFAIHHGTAQSVACWFFNRSGAFLRLVTWSVINILTAFRKESWREQIPLWANVFTAPLKGPPLPGHTLR
jgi:N-acetylglucosaminyl-diphospho-decaprenol L-rhamnosyltransferase